MTIIDTRLDAKTDAILERIEQRHDVESGRLPQSQHVDCRDIAQHVEADVVVIPKNRAHLQPQLRNDVNGRLVAKADDVQNRIRKCLANYANSWVPIDVRIEILFLSPGIRGFGRL